MAKNDMIVSAVAMMDEAKNITPDMTIVRENLAHTLLHGGARGRLDLSVLPQLGLSVDDIINMVEHGEAVEAGVRKYANHTASDPTAVVDYKARSYSSLYEQVIKAADKH